MTFPLEASQQTFHPPSLKRNTVQHVGVKIVTTGVHTSSIVSLRAMGAFESLCALLLESLFRKEKKSPSQMIAKNVAFEGSVLWPSG